MTVRVDQPEHMNLLGLLMKGLLVQTIKDPANARRVRKMKGDVRVGAGRMEVILRFDGSGIEIRKDAQQRPRASVGGGMVDLLGMVTGAGIVVPVLTGKVRIGGNPFFLLKMLPLIRAG